MSIVFLRPTLVETLKCGGVGSEGGGGEGIYVSGYRKYGKSETGRKLCAWRGPAAISGLLSSPGPTGES